MPDSHNRPPRVDPGEYPASRGSLRQLYERLTSYIPQYGQIDVDSTVDQTRQARRYKRLLAFQKDPVGVYVLMAAFGEDVSALREEAAAIDPQVVAHMAKRLDSRPSPSFYELAITDPKLLRAAGFQPEVVAVDLTLVDETTDLASRCLKTAEVDIFYQVDAQHAGPLHKLSLERGREDTYGNGEDGFDFSRTFDAAPFTLGEVANFWESVVNHELDSQLGLDSIQAQEVNQVNQLLDLHEASLDRPWSQGS